MQDDTNLNKFHNLPEILSKLKLKLNSSNKIFKILSLNDKCRLQLEHFVLSIGNYINLIQEEVNLIEKKNIQLQQKNNQYQNLYHQYYQKYLNIQKEMQKQLAVTNAKNNKLLKQNQFLSFINKGLKNQIDQKKNYLGHYKSNKSKEIKNMIKTVQVQVKNGAQKVCQKINKFMDIWENQSESINNSKEIKIQGQLQDCLKNQQKAYLMTQKKKSVSLNHNNNNETKKKKIQSKLAKIVLQQAKLSHKNQRYLQAYLS